MSYSRLFARGLGRDGDWDPCRDLSREASREAEIALGRRDLPCEARGEVESLMGSDGAGDEPMAYPLALLLMGFKCPFWCTLGVPHFMVPDTGDILSLFSTNKNTKFIKTTVYTELFTSHRQALDKSRKPANLHILSCLQGAN